MPTGSAMFAPVKARAVAVAACTIASDAGACTTCCPGAPTPETPLPEALPPEPLPPPLPELPVGGLTTGGLPAGGSTTAGLVTTVEVPTTLTPLPLAVIGTVIGMITWLPERMSPAPLVVGVPAEEPVVGLPVPGPVTVETPRTLAALPLALTGAVIGAITWLPERRPLAPVVVGEPAEDPVVVLPVPVPDPVPDPATVERPRTLVALPLALTGAAIGAITWLPEPMPWRPEVVAEPAEEPVVVLPEPEPALAPVTLERPRTLAALPLALTGAVIGAITWLPEAIPLWPLVVADPVEVGWLVVAAGVAWRAVELWPSALTALPTTLTGTVIGAITWLPDSSP